MADVVVDASLVAKWGLFEEYTEEALALYEDWESAGVRRLAPTLLVSELANTLYKRVRRNEIPEERAREILAALLGLGLVLLDDAELADTAMALAQEFQLTTAYDAFYLSSAELAHCELWTADQRFFNSVSVRLPWVRWIGHYQASNP
jgi:predicted nucleic acid-binding protein